MSSCSDAELLQGLWTCFGSLWPPKMKFWIPPIPNHTKGGEEIGGGKRKYEEVKKREEVKESQSPRVKRSQGPRYLKVTFNYELDSKEVRSCLWLLFNLLYLIQFFIKSCTQGHFQIPQDELLLKLSLVALIDTELNEIFEVKERHKFPNCLLLFTCGCIYTY